MGQRILINQISGLDESRFQSFLSFSLSSIGVFVAGVYSSSSPLFRFITYLFTTKSIVCRNRGECKTFDVGCLVSRVLLLGPSLSCHS